MKQNNKISLKFIFTSLLELIVIILFINIGAVNVFALDVSCNSIQVSPDQTAYKPGQTIKITVTGLGDVSNIVVRYAPAKRNIIQVPYISVAISGTYDSATKVWTGDWTIPTNNDYPCGTGDFPACNLVDNGNGDGEYIIMPNIIQTNGLQCAGNPAYTCADCHTGTLAGPSITPGVTSCTGCHKTIAVDSNYDTEAGDPGVYDMKEYWNLTSGYYWMYEGANKSCGIVDSSKPPLNNGTHPCIGDEGDFQMRFEAESKVKFNGLDVIPLRSTKDKLEGYMLANRDHNYRIFLSYFQTGAPWSSETLGRPFALEYQRVPGSTSVEFLGSYLGSTRHYSNEPGIDFDNFYYAPQFLGKEFIPAGWKYSAIDRIYFYDDPQKIFSGNLDYEAAIRERYENDQLFNDGDTYTVSETDKRPVIRMRLFEAGFPLGSGWFIREDWYFAKGIGRIRIDTKNCQISLLSNPNDPDCSLNSSAKISNPDLYMNLTNYYIGSALTTSATVDKVNNKITVHASSSTGPYTGYLEVKNCVSETSCDPGTPFKWGYGDGTNIWMENGVAIVDMNKIVNLTSGLKHVWFRPWVEVPPEGETAEQVILPKTDLPWSNETVWRIGSVPGDINNDAIVNVTDFGLFKADFGKVEDGLAADFNKNGKVDIFDYNTLVENFGK